MQKKAESRIRESEERYRSLVEHSPLAIAVHAEGRFVYVNPAAVRLMSAASAEDLVGKPILDIVHPDFREIAAARVRRAAEGAAQEVLEEKLVRLDGTVIDAEVMAIPTAYGGRPAVQVLVNDVTGRKRQEEALRAALQRSEESDELKNAFLRNISHEIRTPLNVILGYAQLIEEHLAEIGDHTQEPLVAAMSRAGVRLAGMLHAILDISRLSSASGGLPIAPVRIRLAEEVGREAEEFRRAAAAKGISLEIHGEETEIEVVCDEYCFRQSLRHVLDNAVKFTTRGGVTVRLGRDADGTVRIEVRDTGIGIQPDLFDRIFAPFWQEESGNTRAFEGAGLGLTLTRRYLELNGAAISVESEKGRGSKFTIVFPPPAPAAGPGAHSGVLVVEDDREGLTRRIPR